jgi:hypothetical protein
MLLFAVFSGFIRIGCIVFIRWAYAKKSMADSTRSWLWTGRVIPSSSAVASMLCRLLFAALTRRASAAFW